MDFIAIDFEIANSHFSSACSLGMVFVENNRIVDEKYFLIQPPNLEVDKAFTKIHGLTIDDLKDAPKFDKVWEEIQGYFSDSLVVAHNAQFDLSVLNSCLVHYSLDMPEFEYVCSIPISTRACRGEGVGNSLKARIEHFGIQLDQHHHALADAKACAELVLKCIGMKKRKSIRSYCSTFSTIPVRKFSELKPQTSFYKKQSNFKRNVKKEFKPKVVISEITSVHNEFDSKHPLFEKNLVFTGELSTVDRAEAMQRVVDKGAIIKSGVSGKTDYLIVGKQDPTIVGADGLSTKERKAHELMKKDGKIKILQEDEFLQLLEGSTLGSC
ncbi:exonuclease domain-containing protein [Sutcliffiella halmapala]|uniref:exonuclease domain-containing protein n=1 Tax=Sutcliffiella halmapala TaxID=79882 RepID=UPI000994FDE0|nr:exonuclease domain-containing protein [Sutcliffiella halmapala]